MLSASRCPFRSPGYFDGWSGSACRLCGELPRASIRYALPSFVQPAALPANVTGIPAACRGSYLRLDHGFTCAGKPEVQMLKSTIRLATLTLFSVALIASSPAGPAYAAGGGGDPPSANPSPPQPDKSAPK